MSIKPEHKVFLNLFRLALEFSKSKSQIINELSHYLVDNLISKICIFIAQEKGLTYSSTTKSGATRTFNFPVLYKNILMANYPSVPDYETKVKSLHDLRNIFQHGSESITLSIRYEYAKSYVEITETILKEIGVVNLNEDIKPSDFLKISVIDESIIQNDMNHEYLRKEALIELEKLFKKKTGNLFTERSYDPRFEVHEIETTISIDMRIIVLPLKIGGKLFDKTHYKDLKKYLERNASKGPYIDSISQAPIFGELTISREYLSHISNNPMIGSIIIKNNGSIIYNWRYSESSRKKQNWIQDYYMCAYFLGFLDFLSKLYNYINFSDSTEIIFEIKGIQNWIYSPISKKVPIEHFYSYNENEFIPIKKVLNLEDLKGIDFRFKITKDIFSDMLLGYGYTDEYKIPYDFMKFYKK